MPYDSIDAAKKAGFPTSAEDVGMTLAQINKLAEIYDAVKEAGTADNPMAVAWTQWKDLYTNKGDSWVEQSGNTNIPEGMEAATLSFGPVSKVSEDANGDTIFKDVTLLAEGTWTDGHSRTPTHYSGNELEKMRFEKVTMKMDHDIFGTLPLTNEIGLIENTRFVRDPVAKWLGDVRIFPTQNGKDTSTLLKRGKITDISSELFLKPVLNSKTRVTAATDMIFMGAATVRQGACTVCKFNEGIDTMTTETPEAATDGKEQTPPVAEAPGLAELETGINEQVTKSTEQTTAELNLAQGRIVELEATNKELKTKLAISENETTTKIKELSRKLDTLSKQPVVHTVVAGATGAPAAVVQPIELDSGGFEAYSAMDFSED